MRPAVAIGATRHYFTVQKVHVITDREHFLKKKIHGKLKSGKKMSILKRATVGDHFYDVR